MKNIFLCFMCFIGFNLNVYANDYDQLNLLTNIISDLENVDSDNSYDDCEGNSYNLSKLLKRTSKGADKYNVKKNNGFHGVTFYANDVWVVHDEGYIFHIADYFGQYGHSRVVTCLNGGLVGLQSIADNGIKTIESTNVKWHKDYFEHFYPNGKVTTYPTQQAFTIF